MPRSLLHKPWTIRDDEALRRLWRKRTSVSTIARRMGRSYDTIKTNAARLGLTEGLGGAAPSPPELMPPKLPGEQQIVALKEAERGA